MTDIDSTIADDLEGALRAVDGVTAVYPAAPIPAVIAGEILAATPIPAAAPKLVRVDENADGANVTVLIGVDEETPAHETGRAAHARIVEQLERAESSPGAITVRIGVVGS